MPHRRAAFALLSASLLSLASCDDGPPPLPLEKAELRVGKAVITAELARTPEEQTRGLMFRRSLGKDAGMLFMYDSPRVMSFWMKNTRIPLSIAFIDERGRITQIERMEPYDTVGRTASREPAQYALEMNRGWFEESGVGVGDYIEFPNPPPPPGLRGAGKSRIPK